MKFPAKNFGANSRLGDVSRLAGQNRGENHHIHVARMIEDEHGVSARQALEALRVTGTPCSGKRCRGRCRAPRASAIEPG